MHLRTGCIAVIGPVVIFSYKKNSWSTARKSFNTGIDFGLCLNVDSIRAYYDGMQVDIAIR